MPPILPTAQLQQEWRALQVMQVRLKDHQWFMGMSDDEIIQDRVSWEAERIVEPGTPEWDKYKDYVETIITGLPEEREDVWREIEELTRKISKLEPQLSPSIVWKGVVFTPGLEEKLLDAYCDWDDEEVVEEPQPSMRKSRDELIVEWGDAAKLLIEEVSDKMVTWESHPEALLEEGETDPDDPAT
jgi:hypothetical protein